MLNIVGNFDYTTQLGDTFDSVALAAYDEERMSTLIMQTNPDMMEWLIFPAGITLKIPIVDRITTEESLPPWRS